MRFELDPALPCHALPRISSASDHEGKGMRGWDRGVEGREGGEGSDETRRGVEGFESKDRLVAWG